MLALAGIAGSYFVYGHDAKKHQKKLKSWALRFKADVLEKLEIAEEMTEALYHTLVDETAEKYKAANRIEHTEVDSLAGELKKHWENFISHKE